MDYEKLGSFYLGRVWDAAAARNELLLYDSKDLITHSRPVATPSTCRDPAGCDRF